MVKSFIFNLIQAVNVQALTFEEYAHFLRVLSRKLTTILVRISFPIQERFLPQKGQHSASDFAVAHWLNCSRLSRPDDRGRLTDVLIKDRGP